MTQSPSQSTEEQAADIGNVLPHLLRSMHGFNVLRKGEQWIALPQSLGEVDLNTTDPTNLPGAFVALSEQEVVALIEALQAQQPSSPELTCSLHGYNVIRMGQKWIGLPQVLGAVELSKTAPESLTGAFVAASEAEVIALIEALQAQRPRATLAGVPGGLLGTQPPVVTGCLCQVDGQFYRIPAASLGSVGEQRYLSPEALARHMGTLVHAVGVHAEPVEMCTLGQRNVIRFDGLYYAIPFGTPVDWKKDQLAKLPGIMVDRNLETLLAHLHTLTETQPSGPAQPQLLATIATWNVVAYGPWVYGIPHAAGPMDLATVDVSQVEGLIQKSSREEVEQEIQKRLKR